MLKHNHLLRRFGLAGLLALLIIGGLNTPLLAAQGKDDPPTPTTASDAERPNAYTLQGDFTGNSGTSYTDFNTSSGGTQGGWRFFDTANNATVLVASCTIGYFCWGVSGFGTAVGVRGSASNYGGGQYDTSWGVFGITTGYGAKSAGVYGYSGNDSIGNGIDSGVSGKSISYGGTGVLGEAYKYGVRGFSTGTTGTYGGHFTSTHGMGVYAASNSNYGVVGFSRSNIAVRGISTSHYGFYAGSTSGIGGYAYTSSGQAAFRAHHNSPGPGRYGIVSDGNIYVNGTIICSTGCVQAMAVNTRQGEKLVYAEGATGNYLSDMGVATLKDGRALIKIDPLFADAANLGGRYMVFLTPYSDSTAGLAAVNLSATGFEVRELQGGKGSYDFAYRISAPRKGYEKERLAPAPSVPVEKPVEDGIGR